MQVTVRMAGCRRGLLCNASTNVYQIFGSEFDEDEKEEDLEIQGQLEAKQTEVRFALRGGGKGIVQLVLDDSALSWAGLTGLICRPYSACHPSISLLKKSLSPPFHAS